MSDPDNPSGRILIVDDEVPVMNALCDTLQEQGYTTRGFTSGSAALAAMQHEQFDLLLADLILPEMDGIALLRAALVKDPDLIGIIITGVGTIATAVEAMKSGALDYIQKPFKLSDVMPVLTRALTLRRLRLENRDLHHQVRDRTAQLEFLSVVSHELRTPLNTLNGWTRLLRGGSLATDQAAYAWEVIERSIKTQVQIIDELLDVSRLITGKPLLDMHPISMVGVIGAAIETVQAAATARNIQLNVLSQTVAPVLGDFDRLQQVVWNLLFNAIKFTPINGRVELRLEQNLDGAVELTVSDNGMGIRPEFLPYVFDCFRQQDASSTRTFGGLGLGLSIVRHIVEMHGGAVMASSDGEGQGASFMVRLPAISEKSRS